MYELLDEVGLSRTSIDRYPHEFSGGQRQRIGLARALALNPKLIVADEPVSALDVSIQAQILNLMKDLQARHHLTFILISHDLAVVRYMVDTIGVMYLGKLVELGPAHEVYEHPAHHYTRGLLDAVPEPDPVAARRSWRWITFEASCPRLSTHRPAAVSAPGAPVRKNVAPSRNRPWSASVRATLPPATSRWRRPLRSPHHLLRHLRRSSLHRTGRGNGRPDRSVKGLNEHRPQGYCTLSPSPIGTGT